MKKSVIAVCSISAMLLVATSACQMPGQSELIKGNVQNIDKLKGTMTIITTNREILTTNITSDIIDTGSGIIDPGKIAVGSDIRFKI